MASLLDTPIVYQSREYDCGPAAVRTVCQYLGVPVKRVAADPVHGLHPSEVETALRICGLEVVGGSMTLGDLRHHHRHGRPVCCLIRTEGGGHWVVVRGITRSRVHYQDPTTGRDSMRFADWEMRHWDRDRAGTEYRRHGIAAWITG